MANEILAALEYDPGAGALSFKGVRYLLVRPETIMGLYRAISIDSPDKAGDLFFRAGFVGGRLSAQKYKEVFSLGDQALVEYMARMGGQLGWGRFDLVSLDLERKELEVAVYNSPFASAHGPSAVPVCHFIRGVLAGVGEEIFQSRVDSSEKTCMAIGGSNCRFQVKGGLP